MIAKQLYRGCRKHVPGSWITGSLVWDGEIAFIVCRDPHAGWMFVVVDTDTIEEVVNGDRM